MRFFYFLFVSIFFVLHLLHAQQFVVNGDFEQQTLSGWSLGFYPPRDGDINQCIHRSDKRAKKGKWSLEITTQPILGEEVTLVFNGAISLDLAQFKGQRVILSGWVYIEKGFAIRPINIRFRCFGIDEEGRSSFLGDVLGITVLGKPGEWTKFQAIGNIPNKNITGMDLHCSISPDIIPTIQYLDDLRVELYNPPLELKLLRRTIWQDEKVLPVDVRVNTKEAKNLQLRLIDSNGKTITKYNKIARSGILGLEIRSKLPEGKYILSAQMLDSKGNLLTEASSTLEVLASPWEGAHKGIAKSPNALLKVESPPAFNVSGTKAPKDVPEAILSQPEDLSPDLKISEWQKRGYVVFSRHYLEAVSLKGRPRPGEISSIFRIFASPGEYEPLTISIWAIQPQKDVRISFSDLVGEKASIPSSCIDVRVVRIPERLPSFLEKIPLIDIPKDQTRTFWLNIYIPPTTPPGFYWGNAKIETSMGQPSIIEILVRVLPIKLPPPPKGYGFWWALDSRWNGYYSKERQTVLEQIRRQFVLLREYGCNMVSIDPMPKIKKTDGDISYDFTVEHWGHDLYSLDDLFRIGKETKFFSAKVPLQYPGAESLHSWWISREFNLDLSSDAFADFYRQACKKIDEWAKEHGFTLAFACVDEIGNSPERRQEALRFYRLAKEAGVLTSVTDNSMHGGVHLMGQPRFDEIIDMRVYNFITPEMIEHTRKSKDRLWLYNLGSTGWYAKLDRLVFGFFTERCGAEGYSQWAFQWPGGNTDPYEAATSGQHTGWHYALPAPDGPLPTIALEAVREGIDDARYLWALPPNQRPRFIQDIQPLSTSIWEFLDSHTGDYFDGLRWKIAREAIGMKR